MSLPYGDYHQRILQATLPHPPPLSRHKGHKKLTPAAVLIPIIAHNNGNAGQGNGGQADVLLTRRCADMRRHSGEVAFPGGRVDATDSDMQAAALREAHEEIGLRASDVRIAGFLEPFATGTGYVIQPVIGFVRASFMPVPNPAEVAEVFGVPLAFLMDVRNHQRRSAVWQGKRRHFYVMEYKEHYIWGATAAMLRNLAQRAFI